jgi:hypothetical protein
MTRLSRKQKLRKRNQMEAKQQRRSKQEIERSKREAEEKALRAQEETVYNALPEEERNILGQLRELRGWLANRGDFQYPAPKFFEEHSITDLDEKRVMYIITNLGPYGFVDDIFPDAMELNWGVFQLACQGCGFEGGSEKLLETLARLRDAIPGFQFTPPSKLTTTGLVVPGEQIEFTYSKHNGERALTITVQFSQKPTGSSQLLAERCMELVENGDLHLVEAGTFGEVELDAEFDGFVGDVSQIIYFKAADSEPMDFSVNPATPEQLDEIYECELVEKLTVRLESGQELALTAEADVDFWVEPE